MSDRTTPKPSPLVEQIFDDFFSKLREKFGENSVLVKQLEGLRKDEKLADRQCLLEALRQVVSSKNETS